MDLRVSCSITHRYREYVFFTDYITVIGLMLVNALNVFHWLRPRQDGFLCADDIFRCAVFNENVLTLIRISLKLFPKWPSEKFVFLKNLNQSFSFSENITVTHISNIRWVLNSLKPRVFMCRWPNRHQALIYLNQRWPIVSWTLRNKFTRNSNQRAMEKNAPKVVCKSRLYCLGLNGLIDQLPRDMIKLLCLVQIG